MLKHAVSELWLKRLQPAALSHEPESLTAYAWRGSLLCKSKERTAKWIFTVLFNLLMLLYNGSILVGLVRDAQSLCMAEC